MAELTKLTGTYIRSGSIPTTALSGGVVSSSLQVVGNINNQNITPAQITASGHIVPSVTETYDLGSPTKKFRDLYLSGSTIYLGTLALSDDGGTLAVSPSGSPAGTISPVSGAFTGSFLGDVHSTNGVVSSSTQIDYGQLQNIPVGIASGSVQVKAYLPTDTVSSSAQVTAFLPVATVSSSGQVDITSTTNYSTFSSSLATVDAGQNSRLSAIESTTGSYATTGSNTFVAAQTISDTTNSTSYLDGALHIVGGMSVRKDVRVSGSMTVNGLLTAVSMSTQYVTSSEYNIGVSKITLNDDDNVRFSGLSIVDSGSASPTTASIFWDSLQHRFIYENLSGSAYNSSIIIAGPKHTGSLGDEPTLTTGYIPVATGTDHIDNSVMFQSSSNVGIGSTNPTRKLEVAGAIYSTALIVESTTANITATSPGITAFYHTCDTSGALLSVDGGWPIRFSTNGSERIRIDAAGSLLVGGTSAVAGGLVQIQSSSNTIISVRSTNGAGTAPGIRFFHDTNDEFVIRGGDGLRFFGSGVNERMVITGAGNVGINSTTPGYRLDISGSGDIQQRINSSGTDAGLMMAGSRNYVIYSGKAGSGIGTGNFSIYDATAGLARLTISGSGNVGIGTTNPSEALHVYSTGTSPRPALFLETTNASATPEVRLFQTSGRAILMNLQTNGDWAFQTSANNSTFTERVRINASGSVGIGVSVPRATLHVGNPTAGTPAIPAAGQSGSYSSVYVTSNAPGYGLLIGSLYSGNTWMQVQRTDGTAEVYNLILQPNGGSVGIGTISPSTKLEVSGSIRGDAYLGRNYTSYTYSSGTLTLNTVTTSGPAVFNYVIKVNPNSGGSSSYTDFLYGKIIIGTGWNGSAVTDFINIMHENPTPRSLYNSGGGNLSVDAVFFTSSELTSLATGTSYTLRLKISGFSADPNGITALISQIG